MLERSQSTELRGPRPAPLDIHGYSHKIRKPPKKPVIIYMVSPKVIHVDASEFMGLVQRLTGPDLSPTATSSGGQDSRPSTNRHKKETHQFPVRVKARALNRSGLVPSPSSPMSPTLFLHDLSSPPPCSSALKEGSAATQNWLFHGDFLSQSHACLPSPSYLDLFSQLPDQQ